MYRDQNNAPVLSQIVPCDSAHTRLLLMQVTDCTSEKFIGNVNRGKRRGYEETQLNKVIDSNVVVVYIT